MSQKSTNDTTRNIIHVLGVDDRGNTFREFDNGDRYWYTNKLRDRADGPAVEWADGERWWCKNDQFHRVDGPAIERANGTREWYWRGEHYSFREWLRLNTELTPQQKMLLMLKYGDQ